MRTLLIRLGVFVVFLTLVFPYGVSAQEQGQDLLPQPSVDLPVKSMDDLGKKDDHAYVSTEFKNLSQMYWAIGRLDINSDEDIDNYLKIHECSLVDQYYYNDFEWRKIRDATRKMIKANLATFPRHFEVILPLSIGRYDKEAEAFEIEQKSQYNSARKFEVQTNFNTKFCNKWSAVDMKNYLENIVLYLNRPLTLKSIPAAPELAQLFIEEVAAQYADVDPDLKPFLYERTAYLRMKVKVTLFKEEIMLSASDTRALLYADLHGIEIYADPRMTKLMYSEDMRAKGRVRHLKKDNPEKSGNKKEPAQDYGSSTYVAPAN